MGCTSLIMSPVTSGLMELKKNEKGLLWPSYSPPGKLFFVRSSINQKLICQEYIDSESGGKSKGGNFHIYTPVQNVALCPDSGIFCFGDFRGQRINDFILRHISFFKLSLTNSSFSATGWTAFLPTPTPTKKKDKRDGSVVLGGFYLIKGNGIVICVYFSLFAV